MMMVMVLRGPVDANAADMMVMPRLRRAGIALKADDLRAVLAQAAIHRRLAIRHSRATRSTKQSSTSG